MTIAENYYFFLLTNPFLLLKEEPKSANDTRRNRTPTLRLVTLCLDHYTIVIIAERYYVFFLTDRFSSDLERT